MQSSTTTSATRAEAAGENHVDGIERVLDRHSDHDALAGGEAIGLDDDGRALFADIGLGGIGAGEALIGGGRNIVGLAKVLGEALRALKLRGRLGRAEGLDAGGFEIIDNAGDQRHFRADDDEVDFRFLAEGDHGLVVGDVECDAFGFLRDAGIAGGAVELRHQRTGGDLPGQRVLAAAGTENEDVHEKRRFC